MNTRFSKEYQLASPLMLAPMGGCAGGKLAAAVSKAGALGLVGSGGESQKYLRQQWSLSQAQGGCHGFGINVAQVNAEDLRTLVDTLKPQVVYLSFGDVREKGHANAVIDGGAQVIANAADVQTVVKHADAGVAVIVVQGADAGGHTDGRASAFAVLPEARDALDAAGHNDVLLAYAGGVADGRGVAAALTLGADAVVLGTRLAAAEESDYLATQKEALRGASDGANATTIGRFVDALNGIDEHSSGLPGRCLVNRSTALKDAWDSAPSPEARAELSTQHRAGVAAAGGDGAEWGTTWAGAGVGLVPAHSQSAAAILEEVTAEAEAALKRAGLLL